MLIMFDIHIGYCSLLPFPGTKGRTYVGVFIFHIPNAVITPVHVLHRID